MKPDPPLNTTPVGVPFPFPFASRGGMFTTKGTIAPVPSYRVETPPLLSDTHRSCPNPVSDSLQGVAGRRSKVSPYGGTSPGNRPTPEPTLQHVRTVRVQKTHSVPGPSHCCPAHRAAAGTDSAKRSSARPPSATDRT